MKRAKATVKSALLSGLAGTLVLVLATLLGAPVISFVVIVWAAALLLAMLFLLVSTYSGTRTGLFAITFVLGLALAGVAIWQFFADGAELNILYPLDLALALQLPVAVAPFIAIVRRRQS